MGAFSGPKIVEDGLGAFSGPKIVEDGLVFSLDVANQKCISPLGCTGFNDAPQLVKNLVSPSDTINSYNGVKLGNLSYYTAFAIDYPEGNYGGPAAGRDGITPGYNVTSGTKIYDFTRALNYAVWDKKTENWISSSYFNGSRNSGHCYDTYSWSGTGGAQAQVAQFVSDYNTIKQFFPEAIHIVAGSHRDSNHSNDQYNVLRDLGAPDNVNSIIGFSSPEWILVGEPGLGAGNAYGWAFQNYSTNPTQVAHVNFGLPIYGTIDNYLEFDGTDDYISAGALSGSFTSFTVIVWFYPTSVTGYENPIDCNYAYNGTTGNIGPRLEMNSSGNLTWIYSNITNNNNSYYAHNVVSSGLAANTWHCAAITYDGGLNTSTTYYNGNTSGLSRSTIGSPTGFVGVMNNVTIGKGFHLGGAERIFTGRVSNISIYNKALTAQEIIILSSHSENISI
jgi:hypothetical protein